MSSKTVKCNYKWIENYNVQFFNKYKTNVRIGKLLENNKNRKNRNKIQDVLLLEINKLQGSNCNSV